MIGPTNTSQPLYNYCYSEVYLILYFVSSILPELH